MNDPHFDEAPTQRLYENSGHENDTEAESDQLGIYSSETLPEDEVNVLRAESGSNPNLVGVYYNAFHRQDHFCIADQGENMSVVVCDGVSSLLQSSIISRSLSQKLAKQAVTPNKHGEVPMIDDILGTENLTKVVRHIAEKNKDNPLLIAGGAGTTISALVVDKKSRSIDWSAIGDSPIFVVDRDESGQVISWEILTQHETINNTNYTTREHVETLRDPRTIAASILPGSGEVVADFLYNGLQSGIIEYKPGRCVVIASDFLTKMLLCDPDCIRSEIKYWQSNPLSPYNQPIPPEKITKRIDALINLAEKIETIPEFRKLWIENKFNPAFILGMETKEIERFFMLWQEHLKYRTDDVTVFAIDMDTI